MTLGRTPQGLKHLIRSAVIRRPKGLLHPGYLVDYFEGDEEVGVAGQSFSLAALDEEADLADFGSVCPDGLSD